MPQTLEDFLMTRQPTAERPLLGQTILVVEDSRYVCEALRMICQRSGARIRRADSLRSAERHLRTYRPGIVLVDLGLPDGSGLELIKALSPGEEDYPVVIAMSGDDAKADAAKSAGARLSRQTDQLRLCVSGSHSGGDAARGAAGGPQTRHLGCCHPGPDRASRRSGAG